MSFKTGRAAVSDLWLDDANPRLPERLGRRSQEEILEWFYAEGVLEELAISFLDHGYLEEEPMFAVARDSGGWTVVEGNRRLAALLVLLQETRATDTDTQFRGLPEPDSTQRAQLETVPIRIVTDPSEIRTFLGFRHIGGLKEWPPEAKARWIEEEVQRRGAPGNVFAEIGRSVGTSAQSIRGPYLALRILRHAAAELEEEAQASVQHVQDRRFGVLVRATNSPDLRAYLAPAGPSHLRTLDDIEQLIQVVDVERLTRVLHDMTPSHDRRTPVLSDSREVTVYARAVGHPDASRILKEYGSLELAVQVLETQELAPNIRRIEERVRTLLDLVQRSDDSIQSEAVDAANKLSIAARSLYVQVKDQASDDL